MAASGDQEQRHEGAPGASNADRCSLTTAALFDVLWGELAEVLGTAATSTLLRRAVERAASQVPELSELSIYREGLDHKYAVPRAWQEEGGDTPEALRELVRELEPLLVELTGQVVVQRLQRITEFQRWGLIFLKEDQK